MNRPFLLRSPCLPSPIWICFGTPQRPFDPVGSGVVRMQQVNSLKTVDAVSKDRSSNKRRQIIDNTAKVNSFPGQRCPNGMLNSMNFSIMLNASKHHCCCCFYRSHNTPCQYNLSFKFPHIEMLYVSSSQ